MSSYLPNDVRVFLERMVGRDDRAWLERNLEEALSVNGDAWTPRMQLKALDLLEKYPTETP
jgi:hypothetical protein